MDVQELVVFCTDGAQQVDHLANEAYPEMGKDPVGKTDKDVLREDDERCQQQSFEFLLQSILIVQFVDFLLDDRQVFFGQLSTGLIMPNTIHIGETEQYLMSHHNVGRDIVFVGIDGIKREGEALSDGDNHLLSLLDACLSHHASSTGVEG